jgi:hypothetical protein
LSKALHLDTKRHGSLAVWIRLGLQVGACRECQYNQPANVQQSSHRGRAKEIEIAGSR